MRIDSAGPAETMAVGRRLASMLRPGDIVLLSGRLGAGKTVFVAGVAEGLGVEAPITSPSFVLVRSYDGFMRLTHADLYRLGTTAELYDLDLPETVGEGVLIVEWGTVLEGSFGDDVLIIDLEVQSDETRTIAVEARGSWKGRALEDLA